MCVLTSESKGSRLESESVGELVHVSGRVSAVPLTGGIPKTGPTFPARISLSNCVPQRSTWSAKKSMQVGVDGTHEGAVWKRDAARVREPAWHHCLDHDGCSHARSTRLSQSSRSQLRKRRRPAVCVRLISDVVIRDYNNLSIQTRRDSSAPPLPRSLSIAGT